MKESETVGAVSSSIPVTWDTDTGASPSEQATLVFAVDIVSLQTMICQVGSLSCQVYLIVGYHKVPSAEETQGLG